MTIKNLIENVQFDDGVRPIDIVFDSVYLMYDVSINNNIFISFQ